MDSQTGEFEKKRIDGRPISCEELSEIIESYLNIFSISANPSVLSIYEATVGTSLKGGLKFGERTIGDI